MIIIDIWKLTDDSVMARSAVLTLGVGSTIIIFSSYGKYLLNNAQEIFPHIILAL